MVLELNIVEVNQSFSLFCDYDLQGEPLYSVKWYKVLTNHNTLQVSVGHYCDGWYQ